MSSRQKRLGTWYKHILFRMLQLCRLNCFYLCFQNLRLQKIDVQIKCINEMCNMMSLDLKKTLYDVHPSFVELERTKSMSIIDSTLDRLAGKVHALNQEKKQRLRKVLIVVI